MIVKNLLVKIGVDVKAFTAGMKSADDKIQASAEKYRKAGQVMTIAGAAIIASLGAIVKQASDAEETSSKFGTVFQDVFGAASAASKDLADNYGLSTLAAQQMLSATGDLLTGMGATGAEALELSTRTQQLAVDLASFTNFSGGAKGAADALTKAMLGERESLKALGIVISEAAVKEKLLEKGQQDLTGSALLQAKAFITLEIATEQSGNAIGDFARTSDSFANQSRIMTANLQDLGVELGTHLIPLATALVSKISEVVKSITTWAKENPVVAGTLLKIVAGLGALMAVVGPILIAIPALSAGIAALGAVSLAAVGSIAAATAGIGLLVVAAAGAITIFTQLKNAKEQVIEADERLQRQQKQLRDKLLKASDAAGMTRKEFIKLEKAYKGNTAALGMAIKRGKEGKKLQDALAKVGKKNIKVTKERAKAQKSVTKASGALAAKTKAMTALLVKQKKEMAEVAKAAEEWAGVLRDLGVMTIPQKMARVKELKDTLARLHQEYDAGLLDLADYRLAVNGVKREMEDLQTTIVDTAIPAARDMSDVYGQAVGEMKTETGDFAETVEEETGKVRSRWGEMIDDMGGHFSTFITDILGGASFADSISSLWSAMKKSFADALAEMVVEWATNFVGKIAGDAVGNAASGSSEFGGVWGMLGVALGTVISDQLSNKGETEWERAMEFYAEKNINMWRIFIKYFKDSMGDLIIPKLERLREVQQDMFGIASKSLEKIREIGKSLVSMDDKSSTIIGILESIRDYNKITADRLKSLAGFKTGGSFVPTKPTLITVHPREEVNITPFSAMAGGGNTYQAHFHFSGQLDPNASRRLVREQIGPMFLEYIQTNTDRAKTKLSQSLGR